ncbi:hypothetical protein J6P52_00230 [bacterium]|nr:hypothetical protein [bacterium]
MINPDNLIPRSLFNSRLLIYKSLTLKDVAYIIVCLIIAACLSFSFSKIDILFRIVIFIFIGLFLLLGLIKLTKRDIRIYQFIALFFIFVVNKKQYYATKNNYKNNLDFLT